MTSHNMGVLGAIIATAVWSGWYSETHSGLCLGLAVFSFLLFVVLLVEDDL